MTVQSQLFRWRAAGLVVALTLCVAACDDASTTTSPTTTSPVTETFSGQFYPGGSAARAFTAASAGSVSITLTSIGPPADTRVGLGIGIPQASGSGCYMTQTVQTGAETTPQITATVDAGAYCVRLYDTGTLSSQVAFSVTIVRP